MVLVSDKPSSDIGILQTKLGDREGHEARCVRLPAMPLDQDIEGGHGKRQTPYGQKTRNQLDNRVYDSAIAHSATCILSTPSRILAPREGRTNGGGQTHGLEDTARVYHRDRRSRTAGAQRIPGDRESHPAPSAQRARAVE